MVTMFAVPKVFSGRFNVIQRNAIQSWTKVCDDAEIILLGNEPGTAEACEEYGLKHLPDTG